MKPKHTNARLLASVLFFMLLAVNSFAQGYSCIIKNITTVDSKTIDFDVFLENTGDSALLLQALQGGVNFNYDALANGGTITGGFLPGSADSRLSEKQQSPNWRINAVSHQIQLLAAIAKTADEATSVPSHSSGGIRLGTFEMKNTADFAPGVTPDFTWSFAPGSVTATRTVVTCYVNGAELGSNITNPAAHAVVR